jgi:meiotically up-regulated gene 157 (Mug157) protein
MKHGTQADAATIGRPPLPQRCFTSRAVDAALMAVGSDIADAALASLFNHCLPNTLDTAVQFSDGPRPRCFVVTGDIPAMWLRDAAHQVWPYLRFAARDEPLRRLLAGVIQIIAFLVVSRILYKALAARIEAGELAAGVYLASISIGVGMLNAACMTA